jgi:hypothetical protein
MTARGMRPVLMSASAAPRPARQINTVATGSADVMMLQVPVPSLLMLI